MAPFVDAGFDVSGFDLDEHFLEHARQKGRKTFDPNERYDLIHLSHVVEHFNDPVEFLKNLCMTNLNNNEMNFISVPLTEGVGTPGRFKTLIDEFHLAHKFYFTAPSLQLLGALNGLSTIASKGDNFLFVQDANVIADRSSAPLLEISNTALAKAKRDIAAASIRWWKRALVQALCRRLRISR